MSEIELALTFTNAPVVAITALMAKVQPRL